MMVRGAMWALALSLSLPGVHTELATSFTPRNRLSVLERNLPGSLFPLCQSIYVLKHQEAQALRLLLSAVLLGS